jgi:hypothetical protein
MPNDFVKVPFYIESDGSKSLFLPDVKMTKGFQIGAKGEERNLSDYWEALAELSKMSTPRFRRRNKNGTPGIVKCEFGNIEEVKRSHIEELINKGSFETK